MENTCLNCGTELVIKRNRDLIRKKYCSYNCKYQGLSSRYKGKAFSEEHKKHLKENHKLLKGYPHACPMLGKLHSEETRKKMKIKRARQIIPIKDTKIELKIQNFLNSLKIEYFTHRYIDIQHGYQCDIFIPSLNMVIECDGNYWHNYPTGTDIDHIRTSELLEKGFKVLRLWEFEIKTMSIDSFKNKLKGGNNGRKIKVL